jgi:hypothetical protein
MLSLGGVGPDSTVTGSIRLDLDVPDRQRRYRITPLSTIPNGCRVVLSVGSRRADYITLSLLREHVHRLRFEVEGGDAAVVAEWIAGLRGEDDLLGAAGPWAPRRTEGAGGDAA